MNNDSPNDAGASHDTARCWACGEQLLKRNALRCGKCQTWQNWRKYLLLSSTMLALIVSTISIAIVTTPLLLDQLRSRSGWIEVSRAEGPVFDDGEIKFIFTASNLGREPAVLMSSYFNVFVPSEKDPGEAFGWVVLRSPTVSYGSGGSSQPGVIGLKPGELLIVQISGKQKEAGPSIAQMLDKAAAKAGGSEYLRCFFSFKHLPARPTAEPMASFQSRFPPSLDSIPRAFEHIDGRVFSEVDCSEARFWADSTAVPGFD